MAEPDIVIVGAGAAGIGAGLELAARRVPFLILEASGRVGGRARTAAAGLPVAWDHGCHWFHCADVNPLVAHADRLGARYHREDRVDHFAVWSGGAFVDAATAREAGAATAAAFDAIYRAAEAGRDVPVSEVLPDAGRWASGVRTILQLMASEDPERVSTLGYGDYDDTGVNWPVTSGYGSLIARMAEGLPLRLGTPVTALEDRGGRVRVETTAGAIEARGAIVTVSTAVLASGAIAFGPGPARELLDLAAEVPCGAYEKVAVALRRLPGELAGKLFLMTDPGGGAPAVDIQVIAGAPPLLVAHFGGSLARAVAAEGSAAMTALVRERLAATFGAEFGREILGAATTAWGADPWIRGAYSCARPGAARRRHAMIAAETGAIAFAGEAFSRSWQSTAHGAYRSGRDVAARMASALAA